MLYRLNLNNKSEITPVSNTTFADIGWMEKDLEELLSKNLTTFLPDNQLFVIFQERKYQEEADIYALDKEGKLFIFELKRWGANQENILQVLRYGQKFGRYDYYALEEMYKTYLKKERASLQEDHFKHFQGRIEKKVDLDQFNIKQHFVIVTNGVDRETMEAIQYWKEQGLNIDCLPYKLYKISDNVYFEFRTYNPENDVLYEGNRNIYIVNTNRAWNENAYQDMLRNNKASAYGDRRFTIERIKRNDIVLLYHTGSGVIAYGKVNSGIIKIEPDEYYVPVEFEWRIPQDNIANAVSATQINNYLNTCYSFRGTVSACNENIYMTVKGLSNATPLPH